MSGKIKVKVTVELSFDIYPGDYPGLKTVQEAVDSEMERVEVVGPYDGADWRFVNTSVEGADLTDSLPGESDQKQYLIDGYDGYVND